MTGHKDYNHPKFNRVAHNLRSAGHKVVNPVDIFKSLGNICPVKEYDKILSADLKALEDCKAIYLLKGWESSNGARAELKKAIELECDIIQEGDFV